MKRVVLGPVLLVLAAVISCANSASLGTSSEPDAGGPPLVRPEQDASTIDAAPPAALCIATECVSPFATCPSSRWACDTNLSGDVKNCGGCGNSCPPNPNATTELNMTFACIEGQCVPSCTTRVDFVGVTRYADCNGIVDDGCETVFGTKQNCGSCGDACAPGLECVNFQCGCRGVLVRSGDECVCPSGSTMCTTPWGSKECVDLTSSDQNCSACGERCSTHGAPGVPNAYYGCLGSTCETLKCSSGWTDCDGKQENGCEAQLNSDRNNCGACGHACAPNQECFRGECVCDIGTFCSGVCVDLASDPQNCGRCSNKCPGLTRADAGFWSLPSPNGAPTCNGGRCGYTCEPGWADCDEDIENGCEADILTNPLRCGACNIRCDVQAGQVCSRGKCAMRNCSSEVE